MMELYQTVRKQYCAFQKKNVDVKTTHYENGSAVERCISGCADQKEPPMQCEYAKMCNSLEKRA